MKTKLFLFVFCLLIFTLTITAQKPDPQTAKTDNSQYRQMTEKISKGDLNIDYSQLRKAYSEWLNTTKQTDAPNRDEMVKAFEAKDYAKAVDFGEKVIPFELTNAGLLGAMADAYTKLKNETKSKFYTELAHKVRHSLFLSGDGKTAKTAYYVVGISEEYRVMRELGYTVSGQSLLNVEGQAYDLLAGKDANGKEVQVYFNICIFFGCAAAR